MSVLHVCGDDPIFNSERFQWPVCSPRMWRWSSSWIASGSWIVSVLHVCGDDPQSSERARVWQLCSPRMWRCSSVITSSLAWLKVFSTYVEMILCNDNGVKLLDSVLHVCGEDPYDTVPYWQGSGCSPRMWRWSYFKCGFSSENSVFSTYVEMILD